MNLKKNLFVRTLFTAALAAIPVSGFAADGLSYTWVEADYINLEHGDGAALRGSVGIGQTGMYAFGGLGRAGFDAIPGDDHVRTDELGLGYRHEIAAKTDLIAEVAYQNADTGSFNIDGARGSVGVRSGMGERVEGFVKANYYDASDYKGDVTGTVGGQFKFNKTWGATAEAELGNGDEAFLVGVRASF